MKHQELLIQWEYHIPEVNLQQHCCENVTSWETAIVQQAAVVTSFCQTQFRVIFNYFWLLRYKQITHLVLHPSGTALVLN